MMKKVFLSLITIFITLNVCAQTVYTMQNDSVALDCALGGVLFDSGDSTASYSNNESFFFTVCPNSPTEAVGFDFNSASFGDGDYVCVFDGTDNFAPLIDCYNNVNPITLNQIVRATVSNTSRCLTFQFYSDVATTGDYEIELFCLAPCQNIESVIASTSPLINPVDTTYIDLCFNDTLTLTASALYTENDTYYHQSNATSNFFWKVGNLIDTNIVFSLPLENAGFYPIKLTVEDSIGCLSTNERNLLVRYIPRPSFNAVYDSTLCYGDTSNFYDIVAGENIGGNVIIGDTVRTSSIFSVTSAAQYIPDDADGISGNGISTPATYSVNVTGFIPGSIITNGSQVQQICLDIEHSFAGDIDIVLVAPNGSQIYLVDMNPPQGPGANYGTPVPIVSPTQPGTPETYCWSPTGTSVPIISGAVYPAMIPPLPATYQATGNWNNFIGSPVNGTWTIQVFDDYGGDDGFIFGASFAFDSVFIPPPDSFYVAYDAIGNWESDPFITTANLNQNAVDYYAGSAGANQLIYTTTSDFGCSESDTLHFWVDSFEVVATPADTIVCQGDPVQLATAVNGSTGALTYNWTPSTDLSTSNIPNPIATISTVPLLYTVAVTNSNGCSFYDSVDIKTESLFEFYAMGDTVICFGDSVQLWAAGGAISYDWTPNDGTISDTASATPIVSPAMTTTYTVQADSTGCSQYANIIVEVSNISVFSLPPTNPTCGLTDGGIIQLGSGGVVSPLTYSNGDTTQFNGVFSNLDAGVYPITISDGTGCDYLDTVTLVGGAPLEIDTVITIDPSCGVVGSVEAILTNPTLAVTYTLDIGPVVQDSSLFQGLTGGTYTVTIDDGVCPVVDTTIVLVGGISVVLSVDSVFNVSCFNLVDGEIHLSATGGGAPNFSIDGVNYFPSGSFTGLDTGVYNVFVEEAGCIDSSLITISQPDIFEITGVNVQNILCNGNTDGSFTVAVSGGTNNYQYSLNTGVYQSSNVLNNLTQGVYAVNAIDTNGCTASVTDSIVAPNALNLSLDSTVNSNCSLADGAIYLELSGGVGPYLFTLDGGLNTQDSASFINVFANSYFIEVTDSNLCTDTLTVTVQDDATLAINIELFDSVSCFGLNDASVQLSASGGIAPYVFDIDNGSFQSDSLFSNINGGIHTFRVTDSVGCSEPVSISIYEPAEIVSSFTTDSLSCDESSNGEIHITVAGGVTPIAFAVDNYFSPQLSGDFLNVDAGVYVGYIVDANGCQDTIDPINVYQPDTFIINNVVVQDIDCNGDNDGIFTIATTGGTSALQYNLNSGTNQANNVFNALSGGVYTINAIDANGCIASIIDSIFEPQAILFALDSQRNIGCFNGNDGYLSFTATGGDVPYTYSIDAGANFQSSNIFGTLTAGTYTVIVQDFNGCTESLTVTLTQADQIQIVTSFTAVTCAGSTDGIVSINNVTGGTAPYAAIVNSNAPVLFVNNYSLGNLQGGINHIIQVVDAEGCTSAIESVFINEPDSLILVQQNVIDVSCNGLGDASVSFLAQDGTPTYVFSLIDNGNTITQTSSDSVLFNNLAGGQYSAFVTDLNGCLDSLNITILEPTVIVIDSLQILSEISCFGNDDGSILVHASGGSPYTSPSEPYTYLWSPSGITENKAGPLGPGIHEVTITDANGCSATASQTIAFVDPILASINPDSVYMSMGDTVQLNVDVQNTLSNSLQYIWSPTNGLSCTDCANPTVTIYNDITYSVLVTDSNGCTNYNSPEVFISINPSLFFFIPNGFSPNGDGVNDVFEVYGQDVKTVDMAVFNRWGEKVFQGTNQFDTWDGTFNGVMQGLGVYTYAIDVTFLNNVELNKKGSLTLMR